MKRIVLLSVSVLALFSSCQKNDLQRMSQISVVSLDSKAKTYMGYDPVQSIYIPYWNDGDRLGFFVNQSLGSATGSCLLASNADRQATFTGITQAQPGQECFTFYPCAVDNPVKSYDEKKGYYTSLSLSQTQDISSNIQSFDPACDFLWGEPSIIKSGLMAYNMRVETYFHRVFSILRIQPYFDDITKQVVFSKCTFTRTKSVKSVPEPVCGSFDLGLQDGMVWWSDAKEVFTKVSATGSVTYGDDRSYYLVINPNSLSAGDVVSFEFTAVDGKTTYAYVKENITLSEKFTISAGNVTKLTVDLSKVTPKVIK